MVSSSSAAYETTIYGYSWTATEQVDDVLSPHQHVGSTTPSPNNLGGTIDNDRRFTPEQTFALQMTGCVAAAISLLAGLITLFWFCRMRKEFRHRYAQSRSIKPILTRQSYHVAFHCGSCSFSLVDDIPSCLVHKGQDYDIHSILPGFWVFHSDGY